MFGIGKQKSKCFFCSNESAGWKLEVSTSEGVLSKELCKTCIDDLNRLSSGESLRELAEELKNDTI